MTKYYDSTLVPQLVSSRSLMNLKKEVQMVVK